MLNFDKLEVVGPIDKEWLLQTKEKMNTMGLTLEAMETADEDNAWYESMSDHEIDCARTVHILCDSFSGLWDPHTICHEDYFETMCREQGCELHRLTDSDLITGHVNWKDYANDVAVDYKQVSTLKGVFYISAN